MNLKKVVVISTRDFRSFFTTPVAYIVIGLFLGVMGFMFFYTLDHFNLQNLQYSQMNMGKGISITEGIIRPFYGNMNVIFLLFAPIITMRLFAEERKLHTIELLLTSPITLMELVLGKFLAATLFVLVMLGITLFYPAVLFATGSPDPGPIFTNILGTFLLVSCYISIGVMFSSMTDNQIIAFFLTFATCFLLWLISWASQSAGPELSDFLNYISLVRHYYMSFSQGTITSTGLMYYASLIGFSLFITQRVLDSYRWR